MAFEAIGEDAPGQVPGLARRLIVGGLDAPRAFLEAERIAEAAL